MRGWVPGEATTECLNQPDCLLISSLLKRGHNEERFDAAKLVFVWVRPSHWPWRAWLWAVSCWRLWTTRRRIYAIPLGHAPPFVGCYCPSPSAGPRSLSHRNRHAPRSERESNQRRSEYRHIAHYR